MSLNGSMESISESDLQSLKDNKVGEGKHIDYKAVLPGNSDSDKKEFLADVSSFANATGGHLIFGIKEKNGIPVDICGLQNINPDAEIQRLENILRDGIDPRIAAISIRPITLQNSRSVILMRIPRSWSMPHMVTFKGHSKFYSRNSAGKYPLDVSELRALFALSETTADHIRDFRAERVGKIIARETPIQLYDGPKTILHIVPFSAFDPMARVDTSQIDMKKVRLGPIHASGWNHRHNFDGFLTYETLPQQAQSTSYLQIFHSGAIEAVDATLLSPPGGNRVILIEAYEEVLINSVSRFLTILKELAVDPPLFVMLTLLGVLGFVIAPSSGHFGSSLIDRDALLIPGIVIEQYECKIPEALRPAFDQIWNAAGLSRSMSYDENGEWARRQPH